MAMMAWPPPPPPPRVPSPRRLPSSSRAAAAALKATWHCRLRCRSSMGETPAAAAATTKNAGGGGGDAADEQRLPDGAAAVLASLRVVLVAPRTPRNVGAVARACANFEAPDLVVVAPRCDPRNEDARRVATGGSAAVLAGMRVVDGLSDALADSVSSVAFTRRAGATRLVHASLKELMRAHPRAVAALAGPQQQQQPPPAGGVTALVFGREESGLTEDEIRLCTHAAAIPTGRLQPSMNLSHAVSVVLAGAFERRLELLGAGLELGMDNKRPQQQQHQPSQQQQQQAEATDGQGGGEPGSSSRRRDALLAPAAAAETGALLAKLAAVAAAVGVSSDDSRGGGARGSHGRRRLPLGHARAILARAAPTAWEVRSLHGLASAVLAAVGGDVQQAVRGGGGGGGGGRGGGGERPDGDSGGSSDDDDDG